MQSNILVFSFLSKLFLLPWYKKSRNFVSYLFDKKALAFMDKDCFQITSQFLNIKSSNPLFIQLPIKLKNNYFKPEKFNKKKLRFLYLGRIVNFKYYTLKLAIQKLKIMLKNIKLKLILQLLGWALPKKNIRI